MIERIVLAYSGGLTTSVAIPWLRETRRAEIVAVTLDLGQGTELEEIRDRALASGAARAHVLDVREEFARDYALRAVKADALQDERAPLVTALGHLSIAEKLVEIAGLEEAGTVAHGSAGWTSDEMRLDAAIRDLAPDLQVLAPARHWNMDRPEMLHYARSHGVTIPGEAHGPFSVRANLWGRAIEWHPAGDQRDEPPREAFTRTKAPAECPEEAANVELSFEQGIPTAVNGVPMPLMDLIASLDTIAGTHGVGRMDASDRQRSATGSYRFLEAPAAVVVHVAHKELQQLVTSDHLDRFSRIVSARYSELVQSGLWFTELREALDAFVGNVQERVTGNIRLKLFKGSCVIVGRKSAGIGPDRARVRTDTASRFGKAAAVGTSESFAQPRRASRKPSSKRRVAVPRS